MKQTEFYEKVLQYLKIIVILQLLQVSPSIAETASKVIAYFNIRDGTEYTCNYTTDNILLFNFKNIKNV